jgi:hypothetical protein
MPAVKRIRTPAGDTRPSQSMGAWHWGHGGGGADVGGLGFRHRQPGAQGQGGLQAPELGTLRAVMQAEVADLAEA